MRNSIPFLSGASVASAVAALDLASHPLPTDHLHTIADYAFVALTIPFVLAIVAVVRQLRTGQSVGRLDRIGYRILVGSSSCVALTAVASLITANDDSLGLLYPFGTLGTIVGVAVSALALARASRLSRWTAGLLLLAWCVGGLLGENGPFGFRGSAFILAAVYLTVGFLRRRSSVGAATADPARFTAIRA